MDRQKFTLHIRSGEGAGADLSVVLARLGALEELHEAIVKAVVSPGASRGALSDTLQLISSLRVTGASLPEPALQLVKEPEYHDDGGLLVALPPKKAEAYAESLHKKGLRPAIIGKVVPRPKTSPVIVAVH